MVLDNLENVNVTSNPGTCNAIVQWFYTNWEICIISVEP